MNKNEFVKAVAAESGLTLGDTEKAVNSVMQVITKTLAAGGEVLLVGFGTFETHFTSEHTGTNPGTGEEISIPATTKPRFKPGKRLKEAVNKK